MALRTPLSVTPHLYMGDSTGRPLDKGVVYFGEQDKDPEFYPINLFSDDALTLPLAQPVHTKGGYLYDKGDMVEPHAKEIIYSVKVLDSYGRKVFYKGAMMRNSWNDDVIEQINAALVSTAEEAAQIATDVAKEIADKAVVSSGFVTIDSFELGATITQRNEALRHTADGKLYRWAGDLPKTVPVGSTPTTSGGIGTNAWLEVSDVTLRQDLANPTIGAAMVARGVVAVDSIADLLALPEGQRKASLRYLVKGYYAGSGVGGGEFYWDGAKDKAQHNGGIVFDPDKLTGWSGYQSDIDNLFVPLNTGTGCWVRLLDGTLHSDMFGLVDDDYTTDQFETIRAMIRGISSLAKGRGTAREFDIFIRGGWRAEVKSNELQFPNARYWSDKKAIRLPFTEAFAATDPEYAIQLWGGEYHNFDFDGYRKDYGVGTSPTVPSVGQGALCVLSGAKSYLYNCDLHGSVYPAMVTFGPKYAPTLTDCHVYDTGEHHFYFSGSCNQARFIRCKFGRLSMQGTRSCLVLKFDASRSDPVVDVEFHDITLDTAGGGGTGQASLFTQLSLSGAVGWRLKNFVMDGIDFGEDSTIARIGNLDLSENSVITNFHMRNIKNCPSLFQTSGGSSSSASIFGNTLKNVEFKGGTGGLIFFDEIENISLKAALVTLDTESRSLVAAFKPGQKTHIKNMRMEGEFGNGNLRLESAVNKTVEFTDLVVIDTGAGAVAPVFVTNSNLSIPADSANPQKYIFNNIHIETSNPNSIFVVSGNASGGEIQLEFNGGSINKFMRSSITSWSFIARNGFFADYYQTSSGVVTLVSGNNKPQRYSADETCRGLSVLRKVTIPTGDTSVSFSVSTSSDRLKVNEMEYVIRATPMTQYEGQVEGFVISGGVGYGVRIPSAHTDDLDVLLEIRLHKYE